MNLKTMPCIIDSKHSFFKLSLLILVYILALNAPFNGFAADDESWIIRGNQSHLQDHGIEISETKHGFSKLSKINKIKALELNTHNHWQLIKKDEFIPIQQSNAKKGVANTNITTLLEALDIDRWLSDVTTLTAWNRVTGSTDNNTAKDWIVNKLSALNYTVTTPQFTVNGLSTHNIMGAQIGSIRSDDWYVVGAHMDSIPSNGNAPGAVDNASGCAAVLEMARIASNHEFEGSLLFICYSGEEQGLNGSFHHVGSMSQIERNQIKAALTMDMIGYKDGNTHKLLLETSNAQQAIMQHLEQMAATYAPQLTVYTSYNPFGSDHMPYINNGMPGILSIDDDWDQYDEYHRSTDLPENLNNNQALYIIRTNLAALASLATLIDSDLIFFNGLEQ